jgi:hypothetical protein
LTSLTRNESYFAAHNSVVDTGGEFLWVTINY